MPFVPLAPLAAFLPCLVPFVLLAPLFWSRSSSFPLSSRGEKKSEFGSRVGITGADRTALSVDILLTSMPWYVSVAAFAGMVHDAKTSPAAVAADARDLTTATLRRASIAKILLERSPDLGGRAWKEGVHGRYVSATRT